MFTPSSLDLRVGSCGLMHIAEKVDVEKLRAVDGQGCIAGLVRRRKYIRAVRRFLRIRRIVTTSTTLALPPKVEPTGARVPLREGCAQTVPQP
jgi:hypothetical protein